MLKRLRTEGASAESELWRVNQSSNRECLRARWVCHGTERRCQRARRDRIRGWGDECRRAGSGWVSGRLGAFDDSPRKRVIRSSDSLAEGTQRTCAVWTATRKPGDRCLGHALQRLDDDRSGRNRPSPRGRSRQLLKRLRRTLKYCEAARSAWQWRVMEAPGLPRSCANSQLTQNVSDSCKMATYFGYEQIDACARTRL